MLKSLLSLRTCEMNIAVLDVDGFETYFGPAASAFEIIEMAYYSLCFKGEFQRCFD